MEISATNGPKTKGVRVNATRKWSLTEQKLLLEFLMENREIEKPTAQLYYRRFCVEKNVIIEWPQVRSKVRNLRVSYNKAKAWEGSTGIGTMDGSSLKSSLLKMCSYFDELDDIFGSRIIECATIEESLCSENDTSIINSTEIILDETTALETSLQENLPSTSRKGIYSRTAVSDIMSMQPEAMEIKRQKQEYEKEFKQREVSVMEKNLQLKEKEIQLKEKEINNQRELKILELEMKERLAMEELKLKYKK